MMSASITKRILYVLLPLGLIAFQAYVEFFAPKAHLKFIGSNHLDKIPHFAAGLFLALAFGLQVAKPRLWKLLLLLAAVTLAWETYEFYFDPDMAYFYSRFPDLWRFDMAGDVTAAFLGGYGYWVFFRNRDS